MAFTLFDKPDKCFSEAESYFKLMNSCPSGSKERKSYALKAAGMYERAIAAGYTGSCLSLAFIYLMGETGEVNGERGYELSLRDAENGNSAAMNNVAVCLDRGIGCAKDRSLSSQWFIKAAEAGYSADYWIAAEILYEGKNGIAQDTLRARKLGRKAVEKGLKSAMEYETYFNSVPDSVSAQDAFSRGYDAWNKTRDYEEAVKWYGYAASKGVAGAQCNLGLAYELGQGVKKDVVKAKEFYQKAVQGGSNVAAANLALFYHEGIAVEKNDDKAIYLLQKAMDAGCEYAERKFKNLFPELARRRECEIRIKQGKAEAGDYYLLGKSYLSEGDSDSAMSCLLAGGKLGDRDCIALAAAQCAAGADHAKALSFYLISVDGGLPSDVGNIYNAGSYFRMFAASGSDHLSAGENAALLVSAFSLIYYAALKGHPEAMMDASICLSRGMGCQVNEQKALEMLHRAYEAGESRAVEIFNSANQ